MKSKKEGTMKKTAQIEIALATALIAMIVASLVTVVFLVYGNIEAKSYLQDIGFTDVNIGIYLAKDRCYPSQNFRYRFEATDHRTDGSTEKIAGEVCGGGNETNWFAGFSPLGHFFEQHQYRKDEVASIAWSAVSVQLTVALLLVFLRNVKGGASEK